VITPCFSSGEHHDGTLHENPSSALCTLPAIYGPLTLAQRTPWSIYGYMSIYGNNRYSRCREASPVYTISIHHQYTLTVGVVSSDFPPPTPSLTASLPRRLPLLRGWQGQPTGLTLILIGWQGQPTGGGRGQLDPRSPHRMARRQREISRKDPFRSGFLCGSARESQPRCPLHPGKSPHGGGPRTGGDA